MNIKVKGGRKVSGVITPSGSKNSAVAVIPATVVFDKPVILKNIPDIKDVDRLIKILTKLGSKIEWNKDKKTLLINNKNLRFENLDSEDLGNMKGTALLWGPMLARFRKVTFSDLPGGCTLGARPLDAHYDAFRSLGVVVMDGIGAAKMDARKAKSGIVWLTEMSPTATENVIVLALSLKGKTKILGAASEPQVQDLCNFLVKCGAKISGIGSNVLEIDGGGALSPTPYEIFPDHYEVTTFLAIAAATGGRIKIKNSLPELFSPIGNVFSRFGVEVKHTGNDAILDARRGVNIIPSSDSGLLVVRSQPWPALPVDTLPAFIPLALSAKKGEVLFHNWMYEAGLFWTSELQKMGANVVMCDPHRIIVTAGNRLRGATLEAPYIIRAVVSMVMVAMIAEGESTILNADAIHRGHPNFVKNLIKLGAKIEETS